MSPSRVSLQAILERCGLRLTQAQYDLLWAYHKRLREADTRLNLTRIRNFDNMVLKHYVDSLLVLDYEALPSPLIDMGSGGGLPGIPLKIARPEVSMILAEPRGARAEFLEQVGQQLNLRDLQVYAGKVGADCPLRAAGVITRAVAAIPETLDRVAEVLGPGGRMLLMKGPDCDDEIAQAERSHAGRFERVADHRYQIPGTTHDRRLIVYERMENASSRSPAEPMATGSVVSPDDGVTRPSSTWAREVTSSSNPLFKLCRDLRTGRGVRKHGRALMSGSRVVAEVVAQHRERVQAWITPNGEAALAPPPDLLASAESTSSGSETGKESTDGSRSGPIWYRLTPGLFGELDVSGTGGPLLLVDVPEFPVFDAGAVWPLGCTLFVPFQDPENVGAVIRAASAFGVARVVLLAEAAHPFHPKSVRSGGTSLMQLELLRGPSLAELDASEVPLWALDNSTDEDVEELPGLIFPPRFGLIPGLEGPGLPETLGKQVRRCRIPIEVRVDSLNAAAATAIALYAWRTGSSSK